MSAVVGSVNDSRYNPSDKAAEVWCDVDGVSLSLLSGASHQYRTPNGVLRRLDPIAARNLAALLVRASEEAERMKGRDEDELVRLAGSVVREFRKASARLDLKAIETIFEASSLASVTDELENVQENRRVK